MKVVGEGGGGSIITSISGTVATSQQGTVTVVQGTSPWLTSISGSLTTSLSGTVPVTQSTSPWLTSQSGTITVIQGTSPWLVGGQTSTSSANAGNPVKAGTVFNAAAPTYLDGQIGELQVNNKGILKTMLVSQNDGVTAAGIPTAGDNQVNMAGLATFSMLEIWDPTAQKFNRLRDAGAADAAPSTGLVASQGYLYNGTAYDRAPGDKTNGAYTQIRGTDGATNQSVPVRAVNGYAALDTRDQQAAAVLGEMLVEMKKNTMQLGLLLAQFNNADFDMEGMVN